MTEFNWWTGLLFPWINFLIFAGIIWRFGVPPIQAMLNRKRETYQKERDQALEALHLAEAKQKDLEKRLASIAGELAELEKRKTLELSAELERLEERANRQIAQIKQEAQSSMQAELMRAKLQLSEEFRNAVSKEVEDKLSQLQPSAHSDLKQRQIKLLNFGDVK